ncbi:dicarboxylate/amino acid:cation symporter [bacterium]|nr:dicarboxylate/amino acid:cation symporter [bacterium]
MLLALPVGWFVGKDAGRLGEIATLIVQLIMRLAIPLLFLAIADTILQRALKGRGIAAFLFIVLINGVCAILIALTITNYFQPGRYLALDHPTAKSGSATSIDLAQVLTKTSHNPIIISVVSSIVFASASLLLPHRFGEPLAITVRVLLVGILKLMGWIVHLVPLAVFASVAAVIGKHGFSFIGGLGAYLFFCLLGMFLHVVLVYHSWIAWVSQMSLKRFWGEAFEPVLHGFGINSSLVTLPLTLEAIKRLGVSDSSARLSACVGTNFNNDGILLYEVVAVLFLAQAYGHSLSIPTQIIVAFICIMATIGVSGIPEAGVIALSLALSSANLPIEHIPLLLTVDWIIARTRSAVNVTADITVALSIDALTGRHPAVDREEHLLMAD